jgi:glutathione S-transferase
MSSTLTFYDHPASGHSRRVRCVLRHLSTQHTLPVETVTVDLFAGAQRQPDYLAINPNGVVPALKTPDGILWESVAIVHYLAETFPSSLLPTSAFGRADALRWGVWTQANLSRVQAVYLFQNYLKGAYGMGPADPQVLAGVEGDLKKYLTVLDNHLASRAFLCGDTPTVADYVTACTYDTHGVAGMPVAGFDNLAHWAARVAALPGWGA